MAKKTVLLYSGGMDSWLISKICKPDIKLFFDLGTASSNAELERIQENKDDVVIDRTMSGLGTLERNGDFIVPLRNMFLIARAAEYGEHIILGTNKTDAHNDKLQPFADKMQDILNYYYGPSIDGLCEIKDIEVDFSYKAYNRADLCRMYMENGGSVEEALEKSFSCYTPKREGNKLVECHNCRPCFRKMMGFFVNGAKFPKGYLASFKPYIDTYMEEFHRTGIWKERYYSLNQYEDLIKAINEDCK